jgi:hypothetical protein
VSAAGASDYQYDASSRTWQFNWKTSGLAAGCYQLRVTSPQAQSSPQLPIQIR